eukprot:g2925.t1
MMERSNVYHADSSYASAVRKQFEALQKHIASKVVSWQTLALECDNLLEKRRKDADASRERVESKKTEVEEAKLYESKMKKIHNDLQMQEAPMDKVKTAKENVDAARTRLLELEKEWSQAKTEGDGKAAKLKDKEEECAGTKSRVAQLQLMQRKGDVDTRLRKAVERSRKSDEQYLEEYHRSTDDAPMNGNEISPSGRQFNPSEHINNMPESPLVT